MEDLHAFNSELVARAIVRSKAPVLVGVGHERDTTIADFCADVRASTPSNAAQLLVPSVEEVVSSVTRLTTEGRIRVEKAIEVKQQQTAFRLERLTSRLLQRIELYRANVETIVKNVETLSPENTLKRGYSITLDETGKLLTSVKRIRQGKQLTTLLSDGRITSVTT